MNIAAGTTVSFDWAFLAWDYVPYHDFAFLWSLETGNQTGELAILAYFPVREEFFRPEYTET
ncbi:MAG TPA: hypothetical protein ENJ98_05340 [Thiolapillus brandeum]|uniref:Uncharacterized protein n=1 Tax=Thiolapillus brandeum TaxID=1076588 RepID=A0A7C5MXB3_9GAMM|nr:hypothetical protein [Thiolapillus brandeum]